MDTGHDDDGDGIGDRCDVCPTVADPHQLDTGEQSSLQFPDGIGDACDPRPNIGGEVRVALHTFAAPEDSRLTNTGWTIADDRARAGAMARLESVKRHVGDGLVAELWVTAFPGGPAAADAGAPAASEIQIVLDGDSATTGAGCRLARDRDGDGFDEVDAFERGGATTRQDLGVALAAGDFAVTAFRAIDVRRRAAILCRVRFGRIEYQHALPLTDDLTLGNYVVEAAEGVTASSLVVYTTPLLPQDDMP